MPNLMMLINHYTPYMHKQNKLLDKTWLCDFHLGMELVMFWTFDTFVSSFVSPRIVETRETRCVTLFDEAGST